MTALAQLDGLLTVPVWHADPEHHPSAASVLDIGRDLAYQMANDGTLPVIRAGRFLRVPVPALLRLLGATQEN